MLAPNAKITDIPRNLKKPLLQINASKQFIITIIHPSLKIKKPPVNRQPFHLNTADYKTKLVIISLYTMVGFAPIPATLTA